MTAYLVQFCLQPKSSAGFEKTTPEGLIMGHAYGITAVNTVDTTTLLGSHCSCKILIFFCIL